MVSTRGTAVAENQAWPDRAIARGRLHAVHHGVHSLVAAEARPTLAAEHAALLACGPRAVLSHDTAARLHGLRIPASPGDVHVTVVGHGRGRSRAGIRAHRTGTLPRGEFTRVGRLPVTSVARTVIDLAPQLGDRQLEHLVDQALRRTSRAKLTAVVARHPHRAGVPAVRAVLTPGRPSSDTWSQAEERVLMLLREAGVPAPEANVAVGRYIPDLQWREFRVILEYQSREHHSGERAREDDAQRHNDLTSWGFTVLHVTRRDLRSPERILVWVVAALTRNGWSPAA